MSKIGWGKPRIFIKRIDGSDSTWKEVPTPVQDSTSLETTKGDKLEAKLEGGMNEDVLYMASAYALSYQAVTTAANGPAVRHSPSCS